MPRNVEIKAVVRDHGALLSQASSLCSGANPTVLRQHDVFFRSPNGRLKLRSIATEDGKKRCELIWYDRPDLEGPKLSDFIKTDIPVDGELKDNIEATLTASMGLVGEVKKTRRLFLYGQTRIHVDEVEGLGNYMELEVCLRDEQSVEEGEAIAEQIREALGVEKADLVQGAYMDALNKNP